MYRRKIKNKKKHQYRCICILVPTEFRLILNETLNFVCHYHLPKLESWSLISFTTTMFSEICRYSSWKAYLESISLYNCFGYVDGTVSRICRPVLNERVVYNGHTRVHGVKLQSLFLPNGLIINLVGPCEDQRHDCVL